MARLAAGDELALSVIMNRWQAKVVSYLTRMTGDHAAAVDLAQETFVRLYQNRERYRPAARFSTYLFSISTNLARNHARYKARHPTSPIDHENSFEEPCDSGPTPVEIAVSVERIRIIHTALAALPVPLRSAILMFVDHDMSYAEIAEVEKCSAKAIETRIYRARQILKEQLSTLR